MSFIIANIKAFVLSSKYANLMEFTHDLIKMPICQNSNLLPKRSFSLPHHGNRKHISPQSTIKAHLHTLPKSSEPFDLLGFLLQQHDGLNVRWDGSLILHGKIITFCQIILIKHSETLPFPEMTSEKYFFALYIPHAMLH